MEALSHPSQPALDEGDVSCAAVWELWYLTSTSKKFQSFKVSRGLEIRFCLSDPLAWGPAAAPRLSHLKCFGEIYFFSTRGSRAPVPGEPSPGCCPSPLEMGFATSLPGLWGELLYLAAG